MLYRIAMDIKFYKKTGLVLANIARDMIVIPAGGRIPTIKEYTELFQSSRGIVQNALAALQSEEAITLENRGKMGTFLAGRNIEKLFEMGDADSITGTMPTPLNRHLGGLATGICKTMAHCPSQFTFAFIQGAEKRIASLRRSRYDFVVVSLASAKHHLRLYPELQIALELENCLYSPPFVLCTYSSSPDGIEDGSVVAVDENSTDQFEVTKKLCAGRKVTFHHTSYVGIRAALLSRQADCAVYRQVEWVETEGGYRVIPLGNGEDDEYTRPVILVNRENYGVDRILRQYLDFAEVSSSQRDVVEHRTEAQFY